MRQDGGHAVPNGPSIIELIWKELDESYAELVAHKASEKVQTHAQSQLMGRCAGLAAAIAIMRNPYDPDDDIIRQEVAERYTAS